MLNAVAAFRELYSQRQQQAKMLNEVATVIVVVGVSVLLIAAFAEFSRLVA